MPAPGSRLAASRTTSQLNFYVVINDTASGILLQQQKSDLQLTTRPGACPQLGPPRWLLWEGEDLEEYRGVRRKGGIAQRP